MIHAMTLDPAATQTPTRTTYLVQRPEHTYLRDAQGLKRYRLARVITHGDGTWTAELIRQTDKARDYQRGGRIVIKSTDVPADENRRALRTLHDEIAAALDAVENMTETH